MLVLTSSNGGQSCWKGWWVSFVYNWDHESCLLYGVAGCPLFRDCLSIEVNGRTVGTFRIVSYIVGVRYWGCPLSRVPLYFTILSMMVPTMCYEVSPSLPSPVFLPVLQPAGSVLWSLPHHMRSLHSFLTHQESACGHLAPTTLLETCLLHWSSFGCSPFQFGSFYYSLFFLCYYIVCLVTMETEQSVKSSDLYTVFEYSQYMGGIWTVILIKTNINGSYTCIQSKPFHYRSPCSYPVHLLDC